MQTESTITNAMKIAGKRIFLSAVAITVVLAYFGFTGGKSCLVFGESHGDKLFAATCVACHKDGHNILNPKKPIIGSAKLASKQAFKAYLLKPTGVMQPAPAIANNDADLSALYSYCKGLK